MGVARRLASLGLGTALGLGSALGLWLRLWTCLALLVEPVGIPPLRVGVRTAAVRERRQKGQR
jgi:hypothetical protein